MPAVQNHTTGTKKIILLYTACSHYGASCCFHLVLTLSRQWIFALFILHHLVHGVLAAFLAFAVRSPGFRNVHLKHIFLGSNKLCRKVKLVTVDSHSNKGSNVPGGSTTDA